VYPGADVGMAMEKSNRARDDRGVRPVAQPATAVRNDRTDHVAECWSADHGLSPTYSWRSAAARDTRSAVPRGSRCRVRYDPYPGAPPCRSTRTRAVDQIASGRTGGSIGVARSGSMLGIAGGSAGTRSGVGSDGTRGSAGTIGVTGSAGEGTVEGPGLAGVGSSAGCGTSRRRSARLVPSSARCSDRCRSHTTGLEDVIGPLLTRGQRRAARHRVQPVAPTRAASVGLSPQVDPRAACRRSGAPAPARVDAAADDRQARSDRRRPTRRRAPRLPAPVQDTGGRTPAPRPQCARARSTGTAGT